MADLGIMSHQRLEIRGTSLRSRLVSQLPCIMESTTKSSTIAAPASVQTNKRYHSTSSPFEAEIGYYRAVRHGQHIFVSGTTAVNRDSSPRARQILSPGDARQQTRVALTESVNAVKALDGTGAENVVRVRMFVSRHQDCRAVGEGFQEVLGRDGAGIGTAATMLVVNGFIDEDMLVEVEVDAIVDNHAQ